MVKKSIVILLGLITLLILISCNNNIQTTNDYNDTIKQNSHNNTLTIAIKEFKDNINPIINEDANESINNLLFDGLVSIDEKGKVIPNIAKKWDISEDKFTYTFHLNKGIKFHDGNELTSKDVEFTYKTISEIKNDSYLINIIDKYTISFKFESVDSSKIYDFTLGILPKDIYEFYDIDEFISNDKIIGSGPYKFKSLDENKLYLEKFEDYYFTLPYIEEIEIIRYLSKENLKNFYFNENIDICSISDNYNNLDDLKDIENIEDVEIKSNIDNSYSFIGVNINNPLFYDKNVRKALTYGLNRKKFVDEFYNGYGEVCNSPILKDTWGYNNNINKYEYDVDKALDLLDEARFTDIDNDGFIEDRKGKDFEFTLLTYNDSDYAKNLSSLIKKNYKEIGISVSVEYLDFEELIKRVYEKRDFDMFTMALQLDLEPDPNPVFSLNADLYNGLNIGGYYNEKAEEIFNKIKNEFNINEREKLYKDWIKIANEELPFIFISYKPEIWIINKRVENFEPKAFYDWSNQVEKMTLKEIEN